MYSLFATVLLKYPVTICQVDIVHPTGTHGQHGTGPAPPVTRGKGGMDVPFNDFLACTGF